MDGWLCVFVGFCLNSNYYYYYYYYYYIYTYSGCGGCGVSWLYKALLSPHAGRLGNGSGCSTPLRLEI